MKKRIFILAFFFVAITSSGNAFALGYSGYNEKTTINIDIKEKEIISTFIDLIKTDTNAYKCIDNDCENKVIESYKIRSYKEDLKIKESILNKKVNPI